MIKVKLMRNINDDRINEFLKTTNGKLIDIKYNQLTYRKEDNQIGLIDSVMIIYEINQSGGMQR